MKRILSLAAIALVLSSAASARDSRAEVVRVNEVQERFAVPEEVCREERADRRDYRRRGESNTAGTIVGALIGGALGNQVGKGDGRDAATVGGAVIGGVVGSNIDRNNGDNRDRYDRNDRYAGNDRDYVCFTRNRWETRTAYDVTYRWRGRLVTERFDSRPGRFVRVNR